MDTGMTTGNYFEIPLDRIDVPEDRARNFDPMAASALAAILKVQGIMHPIRVRADGDRFRLVAGLHRLRAFEINGMAEIPGTISNARTDEEARLEEVMENLGRNELTALDRAQHLYELKVVWDRMHPDFANGGGKTFPTGDEKAQIFGFATEVAEKIGMSKRSINIAVKIWTGLTPDSRRRLVGTKAASNQSEIKALSEQSPVRQERIMDMLLSDPPIAASVADALMLIEAGVRPSEVEKRYQAVHRAIEALDDHTLDRVVLAHEERMIASLRRQGKI
ncbi:chromosome partitioning protein ParB [Rhodobacter capsulatus]|uniref:Chromosome partitioning protein ParB n=1 Tax=Rhodobacter capsulatus TaxID=1061 RepID=A0A4U1JQ18_RHOCA|nr:ParB/RepB/Spo0J family partition protein [Rhodobacter capsulatus]TKD17923.1 chromosome partitioning protein ParB [Rhodobacter capsulatus]